MPLPIYMIQPLDRPHDNPISNIYTSFRSYARQAVANGDSINRVLGSLELDAGVDLSESDNTSASELSRWASQAVSSFGGEMSLAARLGAIHLHMKLMLVS